MVKYFLKRGLCFLLDTVFITIIIVKFVNLLSIPKEYWIYLEIAFSFSYFCIFPFFLSKKTLFMSLLGLKISVDSETRISFKHLVSRFLLTVIPLEIGSAAIFLPVLVFKSLDQMASAYLFAGIFPLILLKSRKTLWDQITNTQIIEENQSYSVEEKNYFTWIKFLTIFGGCLLIIYFKSQIS